MKHLIIYTLIIPVVLGFITYKLVEVVINWIYSISDIEDRLNYQLNIFSLQRVMIKRLKF